MAHAGKVGDKIAVKVHLTHRFEQTSYKYSYYGTTTYTYIFRDDADNVFVWKTSSLLDFVVDDDHIDFIHKGDYLTIRGTVKEHSEYKGEPQTVLTRCKYELVERAVDPIETKRNAQKASLADGDIILTMPYRQYKDHYADCETLTGSYNEDERTIDVIVRKGRLKPSGVRGMHYSGYRFENENGESVCYRAVSEENALRRAEKEFPGHEWIFVRFYAY